MPDEVADADKEENLEKTESPVSWVSADQLDQADFLDLQVDLAASVQEGLTEMTEKWVALERVDLPDAMGDVVQGGLEGCVERKDDLGGKERREA